MRQVWGDNTESEIEIIRNIIESCTVIAVDTEFPGVVVRSIGHFSNSGEYHYQTLRMNVEMLKLVQLGFTLCDDSGRIPLVDGTPSIWQFNFKEFKLNDDAFAKDSVDLLKQSGIDFNAHERRGVDINIFGGLLISSGIVLRRDIKWITFHSAYDFGYILKVCTGSNLPVSEKEFFDLLKVYFPKFYDMKYLIKFCDLHGGLSKLAEYLQVRRLGYQHQSGSDSLLTARTFFSLVQKHFHGHCKVQRYCCVLYGLGIDGTQELLDFSEHS